MMSSITFHRWMAVPGALVLLGAAGALSKLIRGEHAMGTTDAVPWGILIAGYVFFAAAATGVGLLGSLGSVFGVTVFQAVHRRALYLALALLLPGFGLIGLELGSPFKMIWIAFSPNFSSGIWWMGVFYSIYLATLLTECWFDYRGEHPPLLRPVALVALVAKVAAVSNLGAVFGLLAARPFWHGPLSPVYLLLTALITGAAALLLTLALLERAGKDTGDELEALSPVLGRLIAALLAICLVLTAWKMYSGLYGSIPGLAAATAALVSGPLALPFWLFEVGLSMILPLVLLLRPRGMAPGSAVAASVSVLAGFFGARFDFVAAGQIAPLRVVEGVQTLVYHPYWPSWTEWALVLGACGAAALIYWLAEDRIGLEEDADHAPEPSTGAAGRVRA